MLDVLIKTEIHHHKRYEIVNSQREDQTSRSPILQYNYYYIVIIDEEREAVHTARQSNEANRGQNLFIQESVKQHFLRT